METLQHEIMNAAQQLGILESQFHSVRSEEAEHILQRAEHTFVRVSGKRWWWTAFRCRGYAVTFTDQRGYQRLTQIAPGGTQQNWLIVNVAEDSPGPVLIYEGSLDAIQAVIGECYAFEYYVVGHSDDWLVCETHHDVVIALGYKAIRRLKGYVRDHPQDISRATAYQTKQ